ncbi:MAG: hypothetical protein U5L96_11555 [Owenweeksia sp.]|nr:hypothetical protein [Owenweeksia sp.]
MSKQCAREVEVREEGDGYSLYRHGSAYEIRGVAGHQHLRELREMGGNTIRVYDTTGLDAILDSAHTHGLAVIVGLWMMGDQEMDYSDTFKVKQQYRDIRRSIRSYKDHPAVLSVVPGQ